MGEYLLLIRTEGDYCEAMEPEKYRAHIKKVSTYIQDLVQQGKLKGAQPLTMNGRILQGKNGIFKDGPFNETKEVIVGYFLIQAQDLHEAMVLAQANPIFNDADARIEIREVKREAGIDSA